MRNDIYYWKCDSPLSRESKLLSNSDGDEIRQLFMQHRAERRR